MTQLDLGFVVPTSGPDRSARVVLRADAWPTNGHLIADVASLYLRPDDLVVDVTYGFGNWWTVKRPERLIAHDIDPTKGDGVDFAHLPEADDSVDVVAFDPPYLSVGSRTATSTVHDFNGRFGLGHAPNNPADLVEWIVTGVVEAHRVLRRGGMLWLKSMIYVDGGRVHHVPYMLTAAADGIGLELVDEFVHVGGTGPQPIGRRQIHARANCSYLTVLGKR